MPLSSAVLSSSPGCKPCPLVCEEFCCCMDNRNSAACRIGEPGQDHAAWGMAEDMTLPRPSWGTDQYNPGSDQHGKSAAAFAALVLNQHEM